MKNYYFLIEHNYNEKYSKTTTLCSKYDGLHLLEEKCEEFIKRLVGGNYKINYYNEGDTNRIYGYFIEKSKYDLNKLTVKHKYIKCRGFVYNEVVIENVISFKLSISEINIYVDWIPYCNDEFKETETYDKVVNEIINTVKLIDN